MLKSDNIYGNLSNMLYENNNINFKDKRWNNFIENKKNEKEN